MRQYFAYCPEAGFETFDTIEKRDAWAEHAIELHLGDFWSDEVTQVRVGEITATAVKCNEQPKPEREDFATEEEWDDAITEWGGDPSYDSICDYKLKPLSPAVETPDKGERDVESV